MAAIHHLGLWRKAYFDHFTRCRTPLFTYTPNKFGEDVLIGGGDMLPKRNSKNVSRGGILLAVPTMMPVGSFICVIMQNFSQIG